MSDTMQVIAAAMGADAQALRSTAQNIANAQSVAYRRQIPVLHTDFAAQSSMPTAIAATPRLAVSTDAQLGTLRSTGEAFNLAIEGQGFFTVSGPQGELLTRRGDFHVDANGVLVTATGQAVLGARGAIQLSGQPVVESDGTVRVGGEAIDRLRIVEVSSAAELEPLAEGLFSPKDSASLVDSSTARVRQGFLETSNVSSVEEMLRLMEITRHFEASQKVARGYHEMLSSAIGVLGKV